MQSDKPSLFVNIGNAFKSLFGGNTEATSTPAQQMKTYNVRGVQISEPEVNELKKIIFSEVSNREPAKQELEARVLFNTAINRAKAYQEAGKPRSLEDILTQPNQYQGYNSPLYKKYGQAADVLTSKRQTQVDDITDKMLGEVDQGTFKDTTNGAYYYQHKGDKIYYDDKRPLFAN